MSSNNIPILSIITVCYNSEKTIQKTFSSIKELKNLTSVIEYIVIDGNSTDSTKLIIEKNINVIDQYISEPDQGIYDGMNKGAKLSTGKYILYINSDDYVNPENFKALLQTIQKYNYDFIGSNVDIVTEKGHTAGVRISQIRKLNFYHTGMPCSHQGFIIKKEIFELLGMFSLSYKIACDYELILKAVLITKNFSNFPYSIATYRLGGKSFGNKAKIENFILQKKYIGIFCAIKNLFREYLSQLLQNLLPNSIVIIIKKLKGSSYRYISKK